MTRFLSVVAVAALMAISGAAKAAEVNLYSYRQPFLIQPLLDAFTQETGIQVNVVYAEKGVLERLQAEGANSPADAVLTVDVGSLNDMVEAGVLQPARSAVLEENIPAQYRHPDGLWYGLSARARLIVTSKDRVEAGTVTSYADLADEKLRGKVCTRSGKHVYMVSLIASQIAHEGEAATKAWLTGVKENLARKPQGNDRAQAKAIHEGECDVAVVNSYYVALMQTNSEKPEEQQWRESITLVFPDQDGRGTHVNISGAAVTKSAKNREEAIKLIEFLSGDAAQEMYARTNFEYPVKDGIALDPVVASWGDFKKDTIGLSEVATYRAAASRLVDTVGYDQGPGS